MKDKNLNLNLKTLEKLRDLIIKDMGYRTGSELVKFFNKLGFNDIYEQGFPSRKDYTEEKLKQLNNTPKMYECIIELFNPIYFVENEYLLNEGINILNKYLKFDNYKIKLLNNSVFIEEIKNKDNILSIKFDENHINSEWKKALERKYKDPEGAITIARTLLETTLKYILDEKKIEYNENSDLSELYKKVSKALNLSPEQHQIGIFKQILGGANGIISGLGALRNKLGDAHGKRKTHIKPKERHSELAVNLSGAMALFLYKTYKDL